MELAHENNSNIHGYEAKLEELSPAWIKAIRHISHYAAKRWGYCQKTYKTIASEIGLSERLVEEVVRFLKNLGCASVKRQGRNPSRIYISDHIIDFVKSKFSSLCGTNVERTPNTIYKNKSNASDAIVDNTPRPEPPPPSRESQIVQAMIPLDLKPKDGSSIYHEIVKHQTPLEVVKRAVERVISYSARKQVKSNGALMRTILRDMVTKEERVNMPIGDCGRARALKQLQQTEKRLRELERAQYTAPPEGFFEKMKKALGGKK